MAELTNKLFFKLVKTEYKLTELQVYAANEILLKLEKSKDYADRVDAYVIVKSVKENNKYNDIKNDIKNDDVDTALRKLVDLYYIEHKSSSNRLYQILSPGMDIFNIHTDFLEFLYSEMESQFEYETEVFEKEEANNELMQKYKEKLDKDILNLNNSLANADKVSKKLTGDVEILQTTTSQRKIFMKTLLTIVIALVIGIILLFVEVYLITPKDNSEEIIQAVLDSLSKM